MKYTDPLGSYMEVPARTQTARTPLGTSAPSEPETPPDVIALRPIPAEERQGLAFLYKAGYAPAGLHCQYMPYTIKGSEVTIHPNL